MTFNELAGKRYSCRKLAAKPVEQEKLDYADSDAKPAPQHPVRKSVSELVKSI